MNTLSRRRFIEYLRASPLFLPLAVAAQKPVEKLMTTPADAMNIFDFMPVAQKNIAPQHWAYLMTGSDDNLTLQANRDGFQLFQIRPRRFVDIAHIDTSVELFGQRHSSPIFLAPCGSQRAFHPSGELSTARAARAAGAQMILSTVTSTDVKEVAREYQQPACHGPGVQSFLKEHAMFEGADLSRVLSVLHPFTWSLIERIRSTTRMKLVAKGVVTAEDAQQCLTHGVDGIIVSNHGGRQEESLLSTIEALPEVVAAVKGKIPVLVDSGFRRGTDVFKALALGASAVCIGRPYLWGLGAFGQPGVERVHQLLQAELVTTMKLAGTTSIPAITSDYVRRRPSLIR